LVHLRNRPARFVAVALILILAAFLVYLPGIGGPWVFDDYASLLGNLFIKVDKPDWDALYRATWSFDGSPLHRPIAMLSFALNHWFAGGFQSTVPFKAVNIAIHGINALLVYFLCLQLFRAAPISPRVAGNQFATSQHWWALLLASIWLVHPIQLTSVLYVIQRMTSLSATFSLLALLSYFHARTSRNTRAWPWYLATAILLLMSVFTKENGILTLLYFPLIEILILQNHPLFLKWKKLSLRHKQVIYVAIGIVSTALVTAIVLWSLPGYDYRTFTPTERLLTEARVLVFYLSLILVPRINALSLFHDDISISTSLVAPWTTLPSILILGVLLLSAVLLRRQNPLFTFGIFWFFIGHLLESTIFGLEIAHEHRNYLPSLGILIALVSLLGPHVSRLGTRALVALATVILLVFGSTTLLRSYQWSSFTKLYAFEALHHPDSPILQMELSSVLQYHGKKSAAIDAARRATELAPEEPVYLLNLLSLQAAAGLSIDQSSVEDLDKLLVRVPLNTALNINLESVDSCSTGSCKALIPHMEKWLRTLINRTVRPGPKSLYGYLLGKNLVYQNRTREAVDVLWKSYERDQLYLKPLYLLGQIYLDQGLQYEAKIVIDLFDKVNKRHRFPQKDGLINLRKQYTARFGRQS